MDDADVTTERQEAIDSLALLKVSEAVKSILAGHAGICDRCGEPSERLMGEDFFESKGLYNTAASIIDGICPPCRDRCKLP